MKEFERKMLLSKSEYDCIMAHFGKREHTTRQINYYFDTDDFSMNRRGVTCRIREKDGKLKATYKDHRRAKRFCSEETDLKITNGLKDNDFVSMGLSYQGRLDTYRTIIFKNAFCTVTVDRNEYLGTTDYELEAEYVEGQEVLVMTHVKEMLELLRIPVKFDNPDAIDTGVIYIKSKSARFFGRKELLQLT